MVTYYITQVSFNTAAIARHLRKVQGGKRRVARTTLTSTTLATSGTMPSETSLSQSSASPAPVPTPNPTPEAQEVDVGGASDSSFETVAEALRLQWSVIGEAFFFNSAEVFSVNQQAELIELDRCHICNKQNEYRAANHYSLSTIYHAQVDCTMLLLP